MRNLLLLATAAIILTSAPSASFAQSSCASRCVDVCTKRGATGSMMGFCQSKCSSNCEMQKAENADKGKTKSKKQQ
jgi:hypothetical protein